MSPTWNSLISFLSDITKENYSSMIQCTHCGNRDTLIKWGFYNRYTFNDELINIPRYRCDNDLCPRQTFSIPPHPFLPILRASLCMLMYVLKMYEMGYCIAEIARATQNTWSRIHRWLSRIRLIRYWLFKEYGNTCPGLSMGGNWAVFVRDFSWTFYPAGSR